MKCPRCGYVQSDKQEECKCCGVIFEKIRPKPPIANVEPEAADSTGWGELRRAVLLPGLFCAALLLVVGVTFHKRRQESNAILRPPKTSSSQLLSQLCAGTAAEQGTEKDQIAALCEKQTENADAHHRRAEEAAKIPAPDAPGLAPAAAEAYERAKQAVAEQDYALAISEFSDAAAVQPDFTEAWYNMGAACAHLAVEKAALGEEDEGVRLFRQAVEAKKKAQGLINQQRWYIYRSADQQRQVIFDLKNGLKDADDVMGDEASLKAALKLWAAFGGS